MQSGQTDRCGSTYTAAARRAAIVAISLGFVVLAGWALNLSFLQTPWPGRPRMLPSVAGIFLLLGVAFRLLIHETSAAGRGLPYRLGQAVALIVLCISGLALAQSILGGDRGLEVVFLGEARVRAMGSFPGRPAFPTSISACAVGLGLLLLDVRLRGVWITEVLAVITLQIALLGLIGHIFGVPELYGSPDFSHDKGLAIHTAAGFLVLSVALLCSRAEHGLMALLRSSTPGGLLARRWIIMPVLLLLGMGLVYFSFQRAFGISQAIESWALFVVSLTMLTAAVWTTAEALHELGLERLAAQHILEERVRERTAELTQAYAALNEAKEELARANHQLESKVQERTMHLNETIRSLETVCYNIAHDLRAPNRAMAGFAQLLLSQHGGSLSPQAMDCLRRIAEAAQRSDALTLDLLAYGNLGVADLPCSKQSLRSHLHAAAQKLKAEIEACQGKLQLVEPLPELWANPAALEQVLTNLLANAFKFVAPGVQPSVVVRAERTASTWRISIQDNGIGISPEHHERVFGVFQRLHPPDKFPGTGIGLAIVQKSLVRMGGKVGVRSSPGAGSCFWFELPAREN